MSVRVMTDVWGLDLADSQKIVLLALADCANDEGHCWPSMATLSAKCSKSARTVQGVIKQLVDAGHLTRREVPGKGCNYTVHPRRDCTPAETAPAQGTAQTPAEVAGHPRSGCGQTVKEPSRNRNKPRKRVSDEFDQIGCPEGIEPQLWTDFVKLRRKQKAPITITVLKTFSDEAAKANWTLAEALTECVARSWRGFKAGWVEAKPVAPKAADPNAGKLLADYEAGKIDFDEFSRRRNARDRASGPPRPIGDVLRNVAR